MQSLKLKIELVPATTWYNNLRKALPRQKWNALREKVYAKYNHRCGICNIEEKLNCHEVWQYDDENHIQKLLGFIALCNLCHHIKHIGLAGIIASQGRLNYENIVRHFMKVNNCGRELFIRHKQEAFNQWKTRSQYEWRIDLGGVKKS